MNLKDYIREVRDFPVKGIQFKDITSLIQNPKALNQMIYAMEDRLISKDFDTIVAAEARGFIFGSPLAFQMNKSFVPFRKIGKLPYKTVRVNYNLEYGTDGIEAHIDALKYGRRVLIVDDLLATGGTSAAMGELVHKLGGVVVAYCFAIELPKLKGREKLKGSEVISIIKFDE